MMKKPILLLLALLTATALHAQEEDANLNVIVNGTAAQIDLSADYPFAAPEEFTATHVPSRMENQLIVNKFDKIVNNCFLKHFCESTNDY